MRLLALALCQRKGQNNAELLQSGSTCTASLQDSDGLPQLLATYINAAFDTKIHTNMSPTPRSDVLSSRGQI